MANAKTRKKFDELHNKRRAQRAKEKIAMNNIYAIYDIVAQEMLAQVQLMKHDAVAIRFYQDVAQSKGSIVNQHPADFDLIRLGDIDEQGLINPHREIVMTGAAWLAMQENNTGADSAAADAPISLSAK